MSSASLEERQAQMRERMRATRQNGRRNVSIVIEDSKSEFVPEAVHQPHSIPPLPPKSKDPTSISREDLYKLVWSHPITKLADRFGVSDVAIAKACRKHDIPLPGLGYWAKVAAGHKMRK